jgi:metal-responsive CopG/Arc/MetJ family transcriptional regulator
MAKFKQMDKIQVYLTPELKVNLDEEHKQSKSSKSEIVRRALKRYLDEQKLNRYRQTLAYQKLKKQIEEV